MPGGGVVLRDHGDRVVMRMPGQPDYWFGNCTIFRGGPDDPEGQVARARADLSDLTHTALVWDEPAAVRGDALEAFERLGFDVELDDVLTHRGPVAAVACPDGVRLGQLASDDDWQAATALQIATGLEEGHPAGPHEAFVRALMAERRRRAGAGGLRWFGAFADGALVADLGLVEGAGLLRFQAVETRAEHRRRGIAAALVSHASRSVGPEARDAVQVIVAERGGPAGRIYRRLGFAPTERIASAVRGSYGPA
jgi:ribosomal protein S18 acetylase RimI-like enzyme